MIITFCGHATFVGTKETESRLLDFFDQAIGQETVEFYLGGYGAFDEFAYASCKKYKETHRDARLVFITPYITEQYQKRFSPWRRRGMMPSYIPKLRISHFALQSRIAING